jgi:Putative auto-transporter adhesin, head GIN domain
MRAHRHWLLSLVVLGIGTWAVQPSQAAATVLVEEEHAASQLRVSGLAGSLKVEGQNRGDIRLEMRGSSEQIERLRREVRGDRLELTAEPGQQGVTTVISGRNNVVIATPGARATQIIGGVTTTVGDPSEPPLEVQAYVPQGAPLVVEGMVGELSVSGVDGPVELELAGGAARLDHVAGGRLAVVGGSRIEAEEASGDLTLEVRGAGDVVVERAALGTLDLGISGSGNVRVGGSAQEARIAIAGVGNVKVDEVRERPDVRVTGIGQIDIGNW